MASAWHVGSRVEEQAAQAAPDLCAVGFSLQLLPPSPLGCAEGSCLLLCQTLGLTHWCRRGYRQDGRALNSEALPALSVGVRPSALPPEPSVPQEEARRQGLRCTQQADDDDGPGSRPPGPWVRPAPGRIPARSETGCWPEQVPPGAAGFREETGIIYGKMSKTKKVHLEVNACEGWVLRTLKRSRASPAPPPRRAQGSRQVSRRRRFRPSVSVHIFPGLGDGDLMLQTRRGQS